MNVLCVVGTRPEAIKMGPVIRLLQQHSSFTCKVCVTGQHRSMVDDVLKLFEITPDYDLNVMQKSQTLSSLTVKILGLMESILQADKPDWLLVQGDTTSVLAAALAAFYEKIRVGHVEAGLRTHNKWQPFPEEINRRVTSVIADLHFAPTQTAACNLLAEGIGEDKVIVTGNPVVDALHWVRNLPFDMDTSVLAQVPLDKKIILVTAHRRENFGQPLKDVCESLRHIARTFGEDVCIIYPVHLNPSVQKPVKELLEGINNVFLLPPLDYRTLVYLLNAAYLVLTDSGGIQEEAPALGKPVLVLREVTERPEGVEAGIVQLVGTEPTRIIRAVERLLNDQDEYKKMAQTKSPYGDGKASLRIANALLGNTSDLVMELHD